jgi:hypothetical protein
MASRRLGLIFGGLLLGALVGCGKGGAELAPVSGRVTLDGRPLENARVAFQPDDAKRPSYGDTDSEGRYRLAYRRGEEGALVGNHTVLITVSPEIVRNPPHIPSRYNRESTLREEVKSGENNEFNFDLKSDAESSKSSPNTE